MKSEENEMATRHGGDKRGSAASRRARKAYLLAHFGNGVTCPCVWCGTALTFDTVESDRIDAGGSYRRENVIPACRGCNLDRGALSVSAYRAKLVAA